MNKRNFLLKLNKVAIFFEILISILLILGIIFSIPQIAHYYIAMLHSPLKLSLELFRTFLSHVLLLVIAMEFVLLMAAHNDTTITHLLLLVVARKMLIVSEDMPDLLIGVIAIVLIFIVRKYLLDASTGSTLIFDGKSRIFSASIPIDEINTQYNLSINGMGCNTLGGLVAKLISENGGEIEIGTLIDDGTYIFELHKVSNGVIEAISVHHV